MIYQRNKLVGWEKYFSAPWERKKLYYDTVAISTVS
jgi:hypothetical protein